MLNKILCIEDDRVIQVFHKSMIKKVGLADKIVGVRNGREALDYCKGIHDSSAEGGPENFPELIFLDLDMPIMGGGEFLDEFEKQFVNQSLKTRIVIISSSLDPNIKKRAKKDPVILDCLSKPLTFPMLNNLSKKIHYTEKPFKKVAS